MNTKLYKFRRARGKRGGKRAVITRGNVFRKGIRLLSFKVEYAIFRGPNRAWIGKRFSEGGERGHFCETIMAEGGRKKKNFFLNNHEVYNV